MQIEQLHPWNLDPKGAVALQRELAGSVEGYPPLEKCELLAGADVSYNRFSPIFYAGVVVLRTSDWSIVERRGAWAKAPFLTYLGLLSFREMPILVETFAKLEHRPDAVMIDGQGLAHPRRLGIACHMGLWLKLPTIGCAKSLFVGEFKEPDPLAGSTSSLKIGEEIVGQVVRTKSNIKPVFVSVGHRIDQASATHWVLQGSRGYRIPEPTRQAHLYVNELRRKDSQPP